jgi:hypothetical protein
LIEAASKQPIQRYACRVRRVASGGGDGPPGKRRTGGPPNELDEVEQALSVLGGRHPGYERAQRELRDAAAAQAIVRATRRRRTLLRRLLRAVVGLSTCSALVAAGWLSVRLVVETQAIAAALDRTSARFAAAGFNVVASSSLRAPHALDLQVPGPGCFVATTAAQAGIMQVRHGNRELRSPGSIGWCSCGSEHVVVSAPPFARRHEGVRLLRTDPRNVGGREGWMTSDVRPATIADGGDECQEAALVGWIAGRQFPVMPVDPAWLEAGPGMPLTKAGFRSIAGAPIGRRFTLVDASAGGCVAAVRGPTCDARGDPLLLEATNGAVLTRGPTVLWCSSQGSTLVVRSSGRCAVLAIEAPAERVGGLFGAREWLARASVEEPATWLDKGDLTWDATSTLRASFLPDATPGRVQADSRFVGSSSIGPSTLEPPDGTTTWCSAPLGASARQNLCAQFAGRPWPVPVDDTVGLAGAPLPFWLASLSDAHDVGALEAQTELVALVRQLASQGFDLTLFAGVTELSPGHISVAGRAHDNAVVAVELSPEAPWIFPYSEGATWPSPDRPRVVSLPAQGHVKLTSTPVPKAPQRLRRTLLFRGILP